MVQYKYFMIMFTIGWYNYFSKFMSYSIKINGVPLKTPHPRGVTGVVIQYKLMHDHSRNRSCGGNAAIILLCDDRIRLVVDIKDLHWLPISQQIEL